MVNNSPQPTILVKKADGTSVRMTMDELQAYKKAQTASAPAPVSAPVTPVAPVKPASPPLPPPIIATVSIPTTTSTSAPEVKLELPKTLHQQSVEVKPEPPKPAPVKFVRPTPPPEEKMFTEKWEKSDNASLLEDDPLKENLPVIEKEGKYMPTNTTPVKNIFVDEAKSKAIEEKKNVINNILKFESPAVKPEDLIPKKPAGLEYIPPPAQIPQTKQIVQDIKPPQIVKQSVGPVDELENFSLDDFRRLEINAKAAGLKLIDKFETLKYDSYLLFIDGVKAWYNSPLYKQYQDVLYQSLLRNKSVNEILTGGNIKKDLKLEEFKAILEVNEAIS